MKALFSTNHEMTPLLLRLALATVFFPHGAQKALGWFGGHGFAGTMGLFTGQMHIPALFAFLAIAAEFAGSLALLAGFFTRVAASGIAATMAVAVATVHWQQGFFMNWTGLQKGEGFEYHLLAIAIAIALVIQGGGRSALDAWITRQLEKAEPTKVRTPIDPALAETY